jgi:hypothetical protein
MTIALLPTMRRIILAMRMAAQAGYQRGLQDGSQFAARLQEGARKDSGHGDCGEREIIASSKKRKSWIGQIWTLALKMM